ncbi:hypothetical protein RESH_03848 [Rhodopirellula europaea SH398]|uniref:Uncharacterized protein n=1 Tax=Rhodopirellula europaea SH398 TaxID=1263868 RepID=M5S260_9BACT|nr:hypothetical protein RESH_03848 [Rhodopirellula europaea SH398]
MLFVPNSGILLLIAEKRKGLLQTRQRASFVYLVAFMPGRDSPARDS